MIQIDGLSEEQYEMLDFMWYHIDSEEEFLEWYDCLDDRQQKMADLLQRMVILAQIDEVEMKDLSPARNVLKKFALH